MLRSGHFNVVKLLIEHGAEVEAKDNKNWTPLIHATEKGDKLMNISVMKKCKFDLYSFRTFGYCEISY